MLPLTTLAVVLHDRFKGMTPDQLDLNLMSKFKSTLDVIFEPDPNDALNSEGIREPMDTLGSLCDKLAIVTCRMWHAQDDLYRLRRMTKEEFEAEFTQDPQKMRNVFKRACDLNLQRNQLIDEIDKLSLEQLSMSEEERKKLFQPKHKMY